MARAWLEPPTGWGCTMSTWRQLVWRVVAGSLACALGVSGCAATDLRKGVPLGDIALGGPTSFERVIDLEAGTADLAIAVRDGKCKPIREGTTIDVTIVGMGTRVEQSLMMGALSWAHADKSCDAYGYLYDVRSGLSEKFELKAGQYRVRAQVRSFDEAEQRSGALWVIYGGRAPTTRMFRGHAPNS